ncbi:MAG: hypothetical protein PHV34_12765 [Verrucomicrobiae bacterium]|nr:hypothetical protein [Verrucomicrobiae bacterium]
MKIEVSESQTPTASQTTPATTPPPRHRQTASPRRSGQNSRHVAPRLAGRLNGKDNPNPTPEGMKHAAPGAEGQSQPQTAEWPTPKQKLAEAFILMNDALRNVSYPDIVKQHVVRLEESITQVGRVSAGLADILKMLDELEAKGEKTPDLLDLRCNFQLIRLAILFCEKEVRHLEDEMSVKWMCRSDYSCQAVEYLASVGDRLAC